MARVFAILFLTGLLMVPVADAACEDEVHSADALRAQAIEGMDRSESVLQQLAAASRVASSCLVPINRSEAAHWYSYELWALYSLRQHSVLLERIDDYLREVAGVSAATDAIVHIYQGGALTRLSRLDEAVAAYQRALTYARRSDNPYRLASVHIHLAELARRMNRVDEVFEQLDLADGVAGTEDFPQRDYVRAMVANIRGDALMYYQKLLPERFLEEREAALERLDEARRWATESGDVTLRDQVALAGIELEWRIEASPEVEREAHAYYARHIEGLRDRKEMTWLSLLATIAIDMNDLQPAVEHLQRAFDLAREGYELEYQARLANELGELHETLGRFDDAARWYLSADSTYARHLREGGSTELLATAFSRTTEPLRNLALMELRRDNVRSAFEAIERGRSQFLTQLRQYGAYAASPDRATADSLIAALRNVRAQRVQQPQKDDGLALEEARLMVEMKRAFPTPHSVAVPRLADLQRKLADEGQVFLSYLIAPSGSFVQRPSEAYVFVVTPDTLLARELVAGSDTLAALIQRGLPLVASEDGGRAVNVSLEHLKTLHDILIAPVDPFLAEGDRLVIAPDGPLFFLPFASLVREYRGRFDYGVARYLIHDHAVSVELSASLLLDPGGDADRAGVVSALSRSHFPESIDGVSGRLTHLPAVEREVDALRRHVRKVHNPSSGASTPAAFFDALRGSGVVHVATHAVVDPASMLNHAIVLNPDSSRRSGVVYAFDLLRRQFDTPLVVLSACATAAGPMIGGEGPAGFQYSFRASGVGSVLATQWLVEDESMAQLSSEFYRNLARGFQKDEALRSAQRMLIESGAPFSHPAFWAAPVLYGDASPVPLRPNRPLLLAVVALLFASLLTILIIRFRRHTYNPHEPVIPV